MIYSLFGNAFCLFVLINYSLRTGVCAVSLRVQNATNSILRTRDANVRNSFFAMVPICKKSLYFIF